jgi:hypothetical protein
MGTYASPLPPPFRVYKNNADLGSLCIYVRSGGDNAMADSGCWAFLSQVKRTKAAFLMKSTPFYAGL